MKIRGAKELRRNERGNMPFALVAVALLLVSSVFCVVYANIGETKDSTENITAELSNIDDAISDAERFIENGLGDIIYQISADSGIGTMTERAKRFDVLKEGWFQSEFPYCGKGFTVEVEEENIMLDVQSTRLSSNDLLGERSVASYLRASGSVKATFTGSAGTTAKTLQITADGTSGLPFLVDCATKFELSAEGDSSLLTQLVSYQLSSLAQSRIVNGYGLRSVSGGCGTMDIITKDDVERAFRNALTVAETVCFRCNGEGRTDLTGQMGIDLAEGIVLRDGCYEIDIGAIMSQAVLAIIDLLVIKWMDFLCMDEIMNAVDSILDVAREFINTVVSFFTGNWEDNRNSARVYIKEAMGANGYSESQYRYAGGGQTTLHIDMGPAEEIGMSIPDFDIALSVPQTDIISWDGWNNYVVDYEKNRNSVTDYIRSTIQGVCTGMMSSYGTVRVPADEFDGTAFADSFSEAIDGLLAQGIERLSYDLESSVRADNVTDMLLASIYRTMQENRDAIFSAHADRGAVWEMVLQEVGYRMMNYTGTSVTSEQLDMAVRIADDSVPAEILCCSEDERDRILELYGNVLNRPGNAGSSVLKELVVAAGREAMRLDIIRDAITGKAREMVSEIKEFIRINCGDGISDIGVSDRFILYDISGKMYEEFTDISEKYTLDISITDPTRNGKNIHSVDPSEKKLASYTSFFTVRVSTVLSYTAHAMSGVDRAIGRYDSSFTGTLDIDTEFDIPCISAWSLTGARYGSSTNIFNEAWKLLLHAIEPLIEPLKKIFEQIREIYGLINSAIIEISSYATRLVEALYQALMEPLEEIASLTTGAVLNMICDSIECLSGIVEGFDIGASKQSITFAFFGLSLTVELRAATLLKTTKNIVKVTLEGEINGTSFSAFIDVKKNTQEVMVRGGGGIANGDCSVNVVLDPLLKFGSRFVKLDGTIRDVDIDVSLPYKELYDEFEMRLSDIPAVGTALSNIPLPIPGFKGAFDMGFDIKYNLPFTTGLMINEFESNPAGDDNGTEWVELYNATSKTVDLSGYMLVPESNEAKAIVITGMSIGPFEKKIVMFDKLSLNNSKSGKHSGESISLWSPEGEKIDSTPWKKDTYNDDRTWQRKTDGAGTWIFAKGTPEASNGTLIKVNAIAKEFLVDCVIKAADQAFEEMGNHLTSIDEISAFLQRTLELFIKYVIDTIASVIVSASVFISLELTDYTQSQHYGLKVGFEMFSDLVREGIYWILNQIGILKDLIREPCAQDPVGIICQNTYITTTLYSQISTPKVLAGLGTDIMDIGYKVGVNVSGVMDAFGEDGGKWKAFLGVVAEGIDPGLLPKGLRSTKDMTCDLWLIKAELSMSDHPRNGS